MDRRPTRNGRPKCGGLENRARHIIACPRVRGLSWCDQSDAVEEQRHVVDEALPLGCEIGEERGMATEEPSLEAGSDLLCRQDPGDVDGHGARQASAQPIELGEIRTTGRSSGLAPIALDEEERSCSTGGRA
jgi:hypothetical protein